MRKIILLTIKAYRLALSPYLGRRCRFEPSCSVYAMQAVERHGALSGMWLAIKRIGKCHPLHPGGFDQVPSPSPSSPSSSLPSPSSPTPSPSPRNV